MIMAMSVLQIRLDENLKNQVSALFERLGMDVPTAVRAFFRRALVENKLPFEMNEVPPATNQDGENLLSLLHKAQRLAYENGVANLSEEEIEAEIKATRAEMRNKKK